MSVMVLNSGAMEYNSVLQRRLCKHKMVSSSCLAMTHGLVTWVAQSYAHHHSLTSDEHPVNSKNEHGCDPQRCEMRSYREDCIISHVSTTTKPDLCQRIVVGSSSVSKVWLQRNGRYTACAPACSSDSRIAKYNDQLHSSLILHPDFWGSGHRSLAVVSPRNADSNTAKLWSRLLSRS